MAKIAPKLQPEIILCDAVTLCANCGDSVRLLDIIQKLAVTNGVGPQATVSIISIADIFSYVFGPDIHTCQDSSHMNSGLCRTCASLLTQLYGLHKLFRDRTGPNTLFYNFIKSKFGDVKPTVIEPSSQPSACKEEDAAGTSDSSFQHQDLSPEPTDLNNISENISDSNSQEINQVEMAVECGPELLDTSKSRRRRRPKIRSLCPQCGKEFNTINKNVLEDHIKFAHEGVGGLRCPICDRPCLTKMNLQTHQKTHLSKEEREALIPKKVQPKNSEQFLCSHCGMTLKSKGALINHVARHTDPPKRYQCDQCDKNYCDRPSLRKHIQVIHEQDYCPISCDNCDERFKVGAQLRDHVLTCKKYERPHECKICHKCFKLKQHLEFHLHAVHKFSKEQAREVVYPGLPKKNP